ncbi:hypothetical protein ACJMK2_038981 [Sinanodonta woodiana]|uniref:Uncharacterized protein n=1 Tax=Sinanodonta woodiana TaxID=1069815 RepID=A0ABD3WC20_SINWO
MSMYPLGQLLLLYLTIVQGEKSDKWDYCGCYWAEWGPWSSCTETCGGGYARRSRKVWLTVKPGCTQFTDCATAGDGWDYQICNANCFNGGSFVEQGIFYGYCKCVTGYRGICCDTIVTCGYPGDISNGLVKGTDYTYNQVVSYVCNDKYNLTGTSSRQCTLMGTWTGEAPTCIFAKHCETEPCLNGASCIDNLGFYTCICTPGWTGTNCEVDIQPPVVNGCSGNMFEFVSKLSREVTWLAPTFTDPMGTSLIIQSNYDNNSYEFPWGDFTVQYTATKPSNGLVSDCVFNISIRPNPCNDLVAPVNGILICNGWKKDYDHVCMFSCLSGFSLPQEFNSFEWYTCGASGNWLPIYGPHECLENESGLTFGDPVDIGITDCRDVSQIKLASDYFIGKLNASSFSAVCKDNPNDCLPDNVDVSCR